MLLILLSSCVSLITLFILFFRVKNTKKRGIPSWFLGKKNKIIVNNNLILKRPPLFPFLAIILITIGFGILFYPKENSKTTKLQNKANLIWVDPSFSAKISRAEEDFSPRDEAEKILSFSYKNYGLENLFLIKNGMPEINYKIVPLNSKTEIQEFIENQNNIPISPFTQSIQTDIVFKLLKNDPIFSDNKNSIIVLSDGKSESLQGILSLKRFFNSGFLKKSTPFDTSKINEVEIIPSELFQLWSEKVESKGQFTELNLKSSNIPEEARPHFYINTVQAGEKYFDFLKTKRNKKDLPLFIVCTDRFPGSIELDPFSSLRSLVNFFSNEFIEKSCQEEESQNIVNKDAWKFRNPALWVVPLTDKINTVMSNDLKFWIPQGFDPNYDTLIYVGGANLIIDSYDLKKTPVQLDIGAYPIPIFLMPPPPGSEIGLKMPGEKLEYKGKFKIFYNAPDGTPLAWKSTSLPFFYLRTTTTTPNGELGRSRSWTHFWFEVANTVKKSNLSFTKIEFDDVNRMTDSLEEAGLNPSDKFTEILNLKTLNFSPTSQFTTGLYKSDKEQKWILISTLENDRNRSFITPEEFSQKFSGANEVSKDKKEEKMGAPLFHLFVAIISLLILLFLWKKPAKGMFIFFLILNFNFLAKKSYAQDSENNEMNNLSLPLFYSGKVPTHNVDPDNIPFRIAWCSKEIPKHVEEKYEKLRTTLIRRGTINLPKMLKAESCKPSEAEIWWTDDPTLLTRKTLLEHVSNGGIFIIEGIKSFPPVLTDLADLGIGMEWESPPKRGMFYRSFYLLQTLNGCLTDSTKVLMLKKKINAQAPFGLITDARFFSQGDDCFKNNNDYKIRSFINIIYSFLTTDYKEDQLQLPEILNRIRNLGLEP